MSVPGATMKIMIRRKRELVLGLLLAFVFSSSLAAAECKNDDLTQDCCQAIYNLTDCKQVSKPKVNCSANPIKESTDITLECSHSIPSQNLSYTWFKDEKKLEGKNKTLFMKKVLSSSNGKYKCCVKMSCGDLVSDPFEFKVETHNLVLLVVCGALALLLVLGMGIGMKIKLKKDQAQHKERMRQRREENAQQTQSAAPIPLAGGY